MCCAIPNAVLLFQWFGPRASFMFLKSVQVENLPNLDIQPFHLVFGVGAVNADYPQVCIGINNNDEANDVTLTPNSSVEQENKDKELQHSFRFVDFNDNGRLEDHVAKSWNADLYETLKPSRSAKTLTLNAKDKNRVVAFKQLDRDTFFIAIDNQVNFIFIPYCIMLSLFLHFVFRF